MVPEESDSALRGEKASLQLKGGLITSDDRAERALPQLFHIAEQHQTVTQFEVIGQGGVIYPSAGSEVIRPVTRAAVVIRKNHYFEIIQSSLFRGGANQGGI